MSEMSIVQKKIDLESKLKTEELEMLKELNRREIDYDNDLPEMSKDDLKAFRGLADQRKAERRKQNLTLRLSPLTMKKARSLGKGYTSILARIIENALNDPEAIKKAL